MTIRVVIADDQGIVRSGLRSLLEGTSEIKIVGEAADGAEAIAAVRRLQPDVALMDIRMPNLDGITATARLVAERTTTRILVLTTFDLDEYVFEALRAGASGFLLKDATAEDLVAAVRVVARGDALLAPAVTRRVIEAFANAPRRPSRLEGKLSELTKREVEVLWLLAHGSSNAEIAKEMFVSGATVKTHVAHILSKLGVRSRVQAAIYAYESGLVRLDE